MAKTKISEESTTETIDETKGLSLRDSLEVAIEGLKEPEADATKEKSVQDNQNQTGSIDGTGTTQVVDGTGSQLLQPPAEYTAEEKSDFLQLSRRGQEAQLRLDRSRKTLLDQARSEKEAAKAASAENEWSKELVQELTPYLKAMGEKMPTHKALIAALKMRNEFENAADPRAAAAGYLKAKGLQVPKELLTPTNNNGANTPNPEIAALRETLNGLINEKTQENLSKTRETLSQVWSGFEQTKNAAGTSKYPDVSDTPTGLILAREIGSLVDGSELSKQFIAKVKARIPNCSYLVLLEEAYKFAGGKVDDSEAPRSQDTQKHVLKSKRVASSKPGSSSQHGSSVLTKKFGTYREAAAQALKDLREAEG